jgi:hypothetical protein
VKTATLQKGRTVRNFKPDSPRANVQNSAKTEIADSPHRSRGQSARHGQQRSTNQRRSFLQSTKEGGADCPPFASGLSAGQQRNSTVNKRWSFLQSKTKPGADGPPLMVRTVRPTEPEAEPALGAAKPRRADGPPTERGRSAVRRQKTDRVLNQDFKPAQNSKFIQMISDEAQNSDTEPLQHHEGNPKRSSPKDRSFMIKNQKSDLNLGFSQKWEIEGFFERNRFQPNEHPR